MHLGIEASRLLKERRGIGRYVRNVLHHLPQLAPSLRVTLFLRRPADAAALTAQLEGICEGLGSRCSIAPLSALPDAPVDVVWYPWNFVTTRSRRAPMVVTTHDLAPMLQFDHRWWKVLKRLKYKRRYVRSVTDAKAILTISASSKREIVERLHVDPAKVHVTLLAADDLPVESPDAAAPLEKAGVSGPFFLTVGAQEARKNLAVLYQAMSLLYAQGVRVPLVQCGPGLSAQTRALHGQAPWLQHVGYVSDAELVTLYRRATALVFPSRYEGFGLPVAEAMRVGGRVICADSSSLPEVAGDTALYFPWNDAAALAAQMQRLLNDQALRDMLTAHGPAQAAKFSWRRVTEETLALLTDTAQAGTQ